MADRGKTIFEMMKKRERISFSSVPGKAKGDEHSWPRITVVTPSFNQGEFLEDTIKSVLSQGYPNLEYIVMDGGSTDGSSEIIKKYEKHLYHWESVTDKGQADAIRKGFSMATGDILAWLNADDCYAEGALFRIAELFKQDEGDIFYGDEYVIDPSGGIAGSRCSLPFPGRTLGLAFFIFGGFWTFQTTSFWKKKFYDKCGGVDPGYFFTMDVDLFIRMLLAGARFRYVRKHLAYYRIHEGSKSCRSQDKRVSERRRLAAVYGERVPFFLRNRPVMRALGALYFYGHIFTGNIEFLFYEILRRTGVIKKHPLMPY
jgi:glycosyltransferase involved in cell wall biosynthesis